MAPVYDGQTQLFAHAPCLFVDNSWKNDGEFLTAIPRRKFARTPEYFSHGLSYHAQAIIAPLVAVGIVVALEEVHIAHQ
jgi:hypothetical protein